MAGLNNSSDIHTPNRQNNAITRKIYDISVDLMYHILP